MLIQSCFLITGCGGHGGETDKWIAPVETTAPTVTAVAPLNNATGVALNTKKVTAAFSEAMDPATLTTGSFTLACPAGTPFTNVGSVTYLSAGFVASLPLTANLPTDTLCTATITTGAKDVAGNPLAAPYTWTFRTALTQDITKPRVTVTVPATTTPPTTGVPTNTAITAIFTKDMDPETIVAAGTFTVNNGVTGAVTYAVGSRTATFTPTAVLTASTTYTATITTAATDLAGNTLAGNQAALPAASNYRWSFTTAAAPAPPGNISVLSTHTACPNAVNAKFTVPSGLPLNAVSVQTNFVVTAAGSTTPILGSVALDVTNNIATFTPTADLTPGASYTLTIIGGATGVKDTAITPNTLNMNPYTLTFIPGAATGACLPPVSLGVAAPFGMIGDVTGATNTGTKTVITGDFSSTATVTSAVTGFHDGAIPVPDIYTETGANIGLVTGKIYTCTVSTTGPTSGGVNAASCTVATNALAAAQTAYNNLTPALLPGGTDPSGAGGELGGLTLAPGIYKRATSFMINGSDLTLDAQGNANAVFVFQMGSTLTVGGPGLSGIRSIILINGAQAKNVFWQVGSSATINGIVGGGTMVGNILAAVKVSVSTVSPGDVLPVVTINGRAVGLTAQADLNNVVINVPAP